MLPEEKQAKEWLDKAKAAYKVCGVVWCDRR
jgi:hypothetical protein